MTPHKKTLLWIIGVTAAWGAALLGIEIKTLGDATPANHLTAGLQKSVKDLPWPWILLALVSGFLMGHCFA